MNHTTNQQPTASAIEFFVPGTPRTAGSKKAFPLWCGRGAERQFIRSIIVDDSGANGKAWRSVVQDAAREAFGEFTVLLTCPLAVTLTFHVLRPKGHMGAKGLRPSSPRYPATKPDVLKLARAVEDALTGVVWKDDAQIVTERLAKRYAERSGVMVRIEEERV